MSLEIISLDRYLFRPVKEDTQMTMIAIICLALLAGVVVTEAQSLGNQVSKWIG